MSQPVGKRRKSRELAMQMLFQRDVGKQTPDEVQKSFWKAREESIDNDTRGFAEDLFRVAVAREEEIDALLEQHSAHWRIPRMPAVDRICCVSLLQSCWAFPEPPCPSSSTNRWRSRSDTPRRSRSAFSTGYSTRSQSLGNKRSKKCKGATLGSPLYIEPILYGIALGFTARNCAGVTPPLPSGRFALNCSVSVSVLVATM